MSLKTQISFMWVTAKTGHLNLMVISFKTVLLIQLFTMTSTKAHCTHLAAEYNLKDL